MIALDNGDKIRGDASAATVVDFTMHGIVSTVITQLADGQLAATIGDLYTAAVAGVAVVSIVLVNTDSSARTVNLYLTPSSGTARRLIPKNLSLGAGYSLHLDGQKCEVLDTTGQILMSWSLASVGITATAAELNYSVGVTSAIQTQMNLKAPLISPSFTTPTLGAAVGTSLQLSGLTASQILGTDASKNLVSLAVATYPSLTELSYIKGLSSAIQTQLGLKAPLDSPTFTGTVTLPAVTLSGNIAGASKVISALDRQHYNETNLLSNGSFEVGDPPTGWTLTGAGATVSRSAAQAKIDTYSALLTRNGTNCRLSQTVADYLRYRGRKVTLGCWVYATVATRAFIQIQDGVGTVESSYHSGVAGWEWITVTLTIDAAATILWLRLGVYNGDTAAYFDGAILVEGDSCPAFSDKPLDSSNPNITGVLSLAGTQVVGARVVDARCDDAINSGDATTDGVIDSLRDAMITHGLIAAA